MTEQMQAELNETRKAFIQRFRDQMAKRGRQLGDLDPLTILHLLDRLRAEQQGADDDSSAGLGFFIVADLLNELANVLMQEKYEVLPPPPGVDARTPEERVAANRCPACGEDDPMATHDSYTDDLHLDYDLRAAAADADDDTDDEA